MRRMKNCVVLSYWVPHKFCKFRHSEMLVSALRSVARIVPKRFYAAAATEAARTAETGELRLTLAAPDRAFYNGIVVKQVGMYRYFFRTVHNSSISFKKALKINFVGNPLISCF